PPPAGGGSDSGGLEPPPGPDVETSSADQFVNDYLAAPASALTRAAQVEAARAYMSAGAASTWAKPNSNGEVTVLRPIGGWQQDKTRTASDGSTVTEVTGRFVIVGQFVAITGILEPPPVIGQATGSQQQRTITFSVGDSDQASGRFRLTDRVPPGLYMSEQALQHWFAPHPVYFWDLNHQALIPDIRYIWSVLSGIAQATEIVNLALGNPSDWIGGATQSLVNANLIPPTISVTASGTYVVNLDKNAHALDNQALLAYQLRWSLGTQVVGSIKPSPVEIEIEGQPQVTSSDSSFREHVANLAPSRSDVEASAYAISNVSGRKAAVAVTIDPATEAITTTSQARILNSGKNVGVVAAAVDGSASSAALVRADSNGQSLWIRRTAGGSAPDFVEVKGLPRGATMSRPQFVTQPAGAVVVAVNGVLKRIDARNRVHAVPMPSGISTISAFSIAPDAHRIAFVSGGRLYFSVITVSDTPSMTPAQPIVIGPSLATATTVAWSSASQLVVGGRAQIGNIGKIAEINVDGSLDPNPFTREYGSAAISQVAAYSYDPLAQLGFDEVMVQVATAKGTTVIAGRTAQRAVPASQKNLSAPFFQD
ncbi:MAG TPA: LpqB family beta-propeller domain-containing protein, partial [Micromonosporaceae bacterium]